jgi:mannose-6-phosphate isomerase-like protein (cupin superfamily)
MGYDTVTKVNANDVPVGTHGQIHLATGESVGLRLWQVGPREHDKVASERDYETVGYVISGHAELEMNGKVLRLEPGDSWLIPKHTEHRYRIVDDFVAIEATSPPSHVVARDL